MEIIAPTTRRAAARSSGGGFGIGIISGKSSDNVGTLWRSAYQLGAAFVFTVGRRYKHQSSDTYHTARHVPLWNWAGADDLVVPDGWRLVGVDFNAGLATPLPEYAHPRSCVYLLGAEDNGLPRWAIERCAELVSIPALGPPSYNVAVAGSIVMYDRLAKARGETT